MFDVDRWQEFTTASASIACGHCSPLLVFLGHFMLAVLLGAGSGLENGVTRNFNVAKNAVSSGHAPAFPTLATYLVVSFS